MAKDFSFPFYVNNWMGGVQYFTFEQKGAYLELLILQFNHGRFTETQVKQVLNISYTNVWQVIKDKFKTDGTYYWNERMETVKEERRLFTESRRNNRLGKKNALSEQLLNNTTKSHDERMEGESEDESKGNSDLGGMGDFINFFNKVTGKKCRMGKGVKGKFNARIKDGFTIDDMKTAIQNCFNDPYHKEHTHFLTPEFILREDKLDKYLNKVNGEQKKTIVVSERTDLTT